MGKNKREGSDEPSIERELLLRKIAFRYDDNAFLAVADPKALQAADRFSAASFVSAWTTGLGWLGRSFPKPTARRST